MLLESNLEINSFSQNDLRIKVLSNNKKQNLPQALNDESIKKLGMRPFNTNPGIDTNKKIHGKY